ncbi:MAG: hypothetical protein KDB79_15385, partial [Acidobacteria bacterium]|nr:hypothetical protein [Acidobacteriota bacterium]
LDRVLTSDGVVIFNLGGVLEGTGDRFLKSELKTYRSVFPVVNLYRVDPTKADSDVQNFIVVAAKNQNADLRGSRDAFLSSLLTRQVQKPLGSGETILTDELAPVEYYNSFIRNN